MAEERGWGEENKDRSPGKYRHVESCLFLLTNPHECSSTVFPSTENDQTRARKVHN